MKPGAGGNILVDSASYRDIQFDILDEYAASVGGRPYNIAAHPQSFREGRWPITQILCRSS